MFVGGAIQYLLENSPTSNFGTNLGVCSVNISRVEKLTAGKYVHCIIPNRFGSFLTQLCKVIPVLILKSQNLHKL